MTNNFPMQKNLTNKVRRVVRGKAWSRSLLQDDTAPVIASLTR
jgi:hypothetical protein